jgi:Uma2 family endonuclease
MSEPGRDGPAKPLTYADYLVLPDDGQRCQLLDGELVVTPSPLWTHQRVCGVLYARLLAFVESRGLGTVFAAPLDVVLDDHNVVQPDILVLAPGAEPRAGEAHVFRAPFVCVEALSPGTERLDRVRKAVLYARHGVAYYWLVDVEARAVEEYELERRAYRQCGVTAGDDVFRPAAFPGFEFRLSEADLPR